MTLEAEAPAREDRRAAEPRRRTSFSVVVVWGDHAPSASTTLSSLATVTEEFPHHAVDFLLVGSACELAGAEGAAEGHRTRVVDPGTSGTDREAVGRRDATGDHTIVVRAGRAISGAHVAALSAKSGVLPRSMLLGDQKSSSLPAKLDSLGFTLGGSVDLDERTVLEGPVHLPCGIRNLGPAHIGAFTYSSSPITESVVSIGRYCSIADGVQFGAAEHPTTFLSTSPFQYNGGHMWSRHLSRTGATFCEGAWTMRDNHAPVIIENDVWIGTGAYIRGGVTIGNGAVVGARAVVTRDVPPYAVVVGNPGRVVRHRFPPEVVERFLDLAWWDFDAADFDGVDVRDPQAALAVLERRKAAGEIREYVGHQRPFAELVRDLQAQLTVQL